VTVLELFPQDAAEPGLNDYDWSVEQGRAAIKHADKVQQQLQWTLGDLALKLQPKYGDATLQHFAEDLGVNYTTLKQYRQAAAAFPEKDARPSFSVGYALRNEPDRADLAESVPTKRKAQDIARERKAPEPRPDEKQHQEADAINTLRAFLRDVVTTPEAVRTMSPKAKQHYIRVLREALEILEGDENA